MPTIIALCPYCRRGGVRAPDRMVGAVATCPKCGSQFTVVPQDDPAAVPPHDETQPNALALDVTEPSPVLPASAPAATAPASAEPEEPAEGVDPAFAASLVALTIFGLGVIATQFPFGRFVGLGLCGLGLLTGLCCLLAEGRARKFGALAAALNLIAVALLALVPIWLGFEPLFDKPASSTPQGPHSITLSSNEIGGGDRIDASKAVYANADVRIGVRAGLQQIELTGSKGTTRRTRENVLRLQLRIANAGVERRVPLSDWALGANSEGVRLTDPAGKLLKPKSFEPGWQPAGLERTDGLFPGKSAEVLLFFEPPAATGSKGSRVEYLRLELPGAAIGQPEPIRFHIPGPI